MKYDTYIPNVVDFAYEIIHLHEENIALKRQVAHYKELDEIHCKSTKDSLEHGNKMIGTMFSAILDPESVINKGYEAIIKEQAELNR